jgi:hypothetical protein
MSMNKMPNSGLEPIASFNAKTPSRQVATRPATTKAFEPRITQCGQPQHREDGGWKSREKSQGNVCQGNNSENAFSHSLDNHSPDFALDNGFNRVGGLKILAKMERNRVSRKSCQKCAIFHYSGTDCTDSEFAPAPPPEDSVNRSKRRQRRIPIRHRDSVSFISFCLSESV